MKHHRQDRYRPTEPAALLRLADGAEPAVVAAALVRAALDMKTSPVILEAART
ncbi:hypothetical protein ACFWOB_13715 [Streptomyces sp. NPDC058420]|uniref:hypothetical protein n=1 Tax=Streptomyces sp. NPDC058420 TaxID=3346489 RepID=UPI00365126E8